MTWVGVIPENWPTLDELNEITPAIQPHELKSSSSTFTFGWFDYRENWEGKLRQHDYSAQLEFEAKLKRLRREEARKRKLRREKEARAAQRKREQEKLAREQEATRLKAAKEAAAQHAELVRLEQEKQAQLERQELKTRAEQAEQSWQRIYGEKAKRAREARRQVANDYPYEFRQEQEIIQQYHAYRDQQAAPPGYMWQLVQATGWRLVAVPYRPFPKRKFHIDGNTQLVHSIAESRKLGLWWFDTPARARQAYQRIKDGYFDRVGTTHTRRKHS